MFRNRVVAAVLYYYCL